MTDNMTRTILSVCATTSNRLPDLMIKNGQLIFIRDKHRIAFDYGGVRTFYNQIEELDTDYDRVMLEEPVNGSFYFVIETAMMWRYDSGWTQLTSAPEEIVFIGTEMPELGSTKTLYISKSNKEICVWDEESSDYMVVADKTETISEVDIDLLFG